jgi:hypothetical protein
MQPPPTMTTSAVLRMPRDCIGSTVPTRDRGMLTAARRERPGAKGASPEGTFNAGRRFNSSTQLRISEPRRGPIGRANHDERSPSGETSHSGDQQA